MFRDMILANFDVISIRMVSKYYHKINYEAVIMYEGAIVTVYYQGIENMEAFCLN
jgi:hypothetical protein